MQVYLEDKHVGSCGSAAQKNHEHDVGKQQLSTIVDGQYLGNQRRIDQMRPEAVEPLESLLALCSSP